MRFPEFADEWKQTTLGEIAEIIQIRGKSNTLYLSVESFLPNFRGISVSLNGIQSSGVIFGTYDTLMSNIRPYLRKVWYADCGGTCSSDVLVFRGKSVIHPRFLYTIIANQSFVDYTMQGAKGVKMPRGDKQQMLLYSLSLPSLAEQKKIASFLSLIDERIQCLSETIKERKREKATLLNQLFSQTLRFPLFFDEWQQTTLGEVAEITSGYSGEQEQMETPYRVSRIETISSGVIDIERVGFVSYDAKLVAYKLSLGDILFSNINSIEHIGKSAIVSRPIDLYHGMNLLRLKAINIDPYVLYYHLQRDVVRNRFRSIANKAVSQASINQTTLGKEPVLLAPTLAEQKKIAYFLSLLDERIEVEEELLEQYERQKRYLLRQMFV